MPDRPLLSTLRHLWAAARPHRDPEVAFGWFLDAEVARYDLALETDHPQRHQAIHVDECLHQQKGLRQFVQGDGFIEGIAVFVTELRLDGLGHAAHVERPNLGVLRFV